MKYRFVVKDPSIGYMGTMLWLPKKMVNLVAIKSSLEFLVFNDKDSWLRLWEESSNHIGVPRNYIPQHKWKNLPFPIIQLNDEYFPKCRFKSNLVLDALNPSSDTQRKAYSAFINSKNGILNLACGKGKSNISIHVIAHFGYNSLIIVNQSTILKQWHDLINRTLEFDGRIGIIQKSPQNWDWKHPITLATIQSLSRNPDAITPEMRRWFGVVIWDELHHLSAPLFCVTATMFTGRRYGLTATVNREDGTHVIYEYHIGDVFYKDLMQTVKPEIIFKQTPFFISPSVYREVALDKRGMVNIGKIRSYVGEMENRNEYLVKEIKTIYETGRKPLVLSHCKSQLNILHDKLQSIGIDCGICTGDQEVDKRWQALRDKKLVLGTHQLVTEAIDEKSLDTLIWISPFGSNHPEGGKNALQQGMGRIQGYRYNPSMRPPLVVIFDDVYILQFHKMCNQLRKQLRRWPEDEGGPYKFKIEGL